MAGFGIGLEHCNDTKSKRPCVGTLTHSGSNVKWYMTLENGLAAPPKLNSYHTVQ